MSTEGEDFAENIRQMRACLPISPSLLAWVREHYRTTPEAHLHADGLALLLRYLGAPSEIPAGEPPGVMAALFEAVDRLGERAPATTGEYLVRSLGPLIVQAKAAEGFGQSLVVHQLHPTAIRAVRETDLAFWPSTPPRALTRPLLVRATPGKGDGALLGPVDQILVVPDPASGLAWICAHARGVGSALHALRASWSSSEDPEEEVEKVLAANVAGISRISIRGECLELNTAALLKFIVTMALFLEAETADGRRVAQVRAEAGVLPSGRPPKRGQGWTVRHVRISDEAILSAPRQPSDTRRGAPPHPEGLVAEEVTVRGFLRRQVCGKGRTERKTIYVAPFRRLQWKAQEKLVMVR